MASKEETSSLASHLPQTILVLENTRHHFVKGTFQFKYCHWNWSL